MLCYGKMFPNFAKECVACYHYHLFFSYTTHRARNDSLPQVIYEYYLRQRYFHPETKNVNAIVFLALYIRHVKPFVDHKGMLYMYLKILRACIPRNDSKMIQALFLN